MLEFSRIAVGEGSAPACSRCGEVAGPTYHSAEHVRQAIADAVQANSDLSGPNLCLAGAEPFEHPELPQLVAACVQAGARRIALETDAAALSVARNALGVISAGVHHLHARLLETDPVRGEALGVTPGRTLDSLAGIEAYRQAAATASVPVVVSLLVPVCPHNLAALPEIVVRAAALHVERVRLLHEGRLPSSASAVLAAACDTGMVNGVWVEADDMLELPDSHRLHLVPEAPL